PKFVGRQLFEQLMTSPLNSDMRAEELVGRAEKKVAAQILHVEQRVWSIVDRIEHGQRSDGPSPLTNFTHRIDGFHGIRGTSDRYQASPTCDAGAKFIHVKRAVFLAYANHLDRGSDIPSGQNPRSDIRIMIQ